MPMPPSFVSVPVKYFDELLRQAHGLEDLRPGVRRHRGDAHLRHDLQHALAERVDEVLDGLLGVTP
jgi:hypothetical protein